MTRESEEVFAVSVPDLIHGAEKVYHEGHEVVDSAIWREHVWLDYAEGGGAWFEQDQQITVEYEEELREEERLLKIIQTAERASVEELTRGIPVVVGFLGVMDSRPHNGIARVRPKGHPGWIAVVPVDAVQPVTSTD